MEEKTELNIGKVFFVNILLEFTLTIILLFILSMLLSLTTLEEKIIEPAIITISTFSVLLGGFIISRKVKKKGIIIGILQGLIYMFILYLISSILTNNFSLSLNSFIMIGIGLVGGATRRNFWSKCKMI